MKKLFSSKFGRLFLSELIWLAAIVQALEKSRSPSAGVTKVLSQVFQCGFESHFSNFPNFSISAYMACAGHWNFEDLNTKKLVPYLQILSGTLF